MSCSLKIDIMDRGACGSLGVSLKQLAIPALMKRYHLSAQQAAGFWDCIEDTKKACLRELKVDSTDVTTVWCIRQSEEPVLHIEGDVLLGSWQWLQRFSQSKMFFGWWAFTLMVYTVYMLGNAFGMSSDVSAGLQWFMMCFVAPPVLGLIAHMNQHIATRLLTEFQFAYPVFTLLSVKVLTLIYVDRIFDPDAALVTSIGHVLYQLFELSASTVVFAGDAFLRVPVAAKRIICTYWLYVAVYNILYLYTNAAMSQLFDEGASSICVFQFCQTAGNILLSSWQVLVVFLAKFWLSVIRKPNQSVVLQTGYVWSTGRTDSKGAFDESIDEIASANILANSQGKANTTASSGQSLVSLTVLSAQTVKGECIDRPTDSFAV